MGSLPEDKHWLIGFRPVIARPPESPPLVVAPDPVHMCSVSQESVSPAVEPSQDAPSFVGPWPYIIIDPTAHGPVYAAHNHDPSLTVCPNGDLLAIWYSCMSEAESDRELTIAAARRRRGRIEWDQASPFWGAPGRNNHAPAIGYDGDRTLYHFTGLSAAASWSNLAIVMRTSTDNGASWSRARLIVPEHAPGHMPSGSLLVTSNGDLVLPVDTRGGTGLYVSRNQGGTWQDQGGTIAGIHAGVVELNNGRLLALGRGHAIEGKMPMSLSDDMGRSWSYRASPFPSIQGGQRLALIRLQEGPLFLASFANNAGLTISDSGGVNRPVSGLFGALSFDEGDTWPVRRLLVPDNPPRLVATTTNRPPFLMDASHGEPVGYLAACQAQDRTVHVISSRNHYAFNIAWLTAGASR